MLSTKTAAGNSPVPVDYYFTDQAPENGLNYYRLKQVDHNNDYNYSKVNSVDNGTVLSQEIIPNPNNGSFKLHLSSNSVGNMYISVVSQYGQRCYSEEIKAEANMIKEISLVDKAKGVYYVILTQNETVSKLKFVIR